MVYITKIKNVCLYKFFYTLQEQMFCHVPLKEAKRPDGSDDDSICVSSLAAFLKLLSCISLFCFTS